MDDAHLARWRHEHTFGTDVQAPGERRTRWVIALTFVTMLAEITAGTVYGSMALLADGWHMASHAAALSITVFAYWFARRNARNDRFSFGTGKVWPLGGFASAVALAVVALLVFVESAGRFLSPVAIHFDEAIAVAALGLVVNLVSAWLLRGEHDHHHGHGHGHGHDHADHAPHHHHHDHNLRAAYLHVLADALTSVFALAALFAGRFLDWAWMDPLMGIVGSLVIARWSFGLLRDTSLVLLDAEADAAERAAIRALIEAEPDTHVVDLHVWRVGPGHLAAIVAVVARTAQGPDHYRALLQGRTELAHVTIESRSWAAADDAPG